MGFLYAKRPKPAIRIVKHTLTMEIMIFRFVTILMPTGDSEREIQTAIVHSSTNLLANPGKLIIKLHVV